MVAPLDKLMKRLLSTVEEQSPVSYADVLAQYTDERTCKLSSCLRRLQGRGLVDYSQGRYSITDQGREELAADV